MLSSSAAQALEALVDVLERYRPDGRIGALEGLATTLSPLISQLEADAGDQAWVRELRSAWWSLEVVDAMALDADESSLSSAEVASVVEAYQAFVTLAEAHRETARTVREG